MIPMIAEIFSAENDWADVFFLVAVIVAVLSAIGSFGANALSKHAGWLLSAAVACASFAWLLL